MKAFAIIRTAVIVASVTLLVWLFAEAESLRVLEASTDVTLAVDPASDRTVNFVAQGDGAAPQRIRVSLELQGSAAAIDAAERVLRRPLLFSATSDGVPQSSGDHALILRDVIRQHPDLRGLAFTVQKCDPAEVRINIDELISRTIPVVLDVPAADLDGVAEVRPPSVQVRGPRAAMDKLGPQATATLELQEGAVNTLARGRKQALAALPIRPPQQLAGVLHVSILPSVADVAFTLRTAERTVTIATVPVHLRLAPAELAKWEITIPEPDRFLSDVVLTGPPDAIRAIEEKTVPVIATVSLSFEELERMIVSKEATLSDLPAGVRPAAAAGKPIRLTIRPREAAKGTGP